METRTARRWALALSGLLWFSCKPTVIQRDNYEELGPDSGELQAGFDGGGGGQGSEGSDGTGDTDDPAASSRDGGPAATSDAGGAAPVDFQECAGAVAVPRNVYGPADVIIAIDNTTSMYDEIEEVRANMNLFSAQVGAAGLNMRIVLVSCLTEECLAPNSRDNNWHTICIDAPVGAEGGCPPEGPDSDTNLPDFLHVDRRIESLKALGRLVQTHADWRGMMRPEAVKHVVVISDDNDEWSAQDFDQAFTALHPSYQGYTFHGIYSFLSKQAACNISGSEPCCTFAPPDGEGTVYRDLARLTGGVSGDLCVQDFDPVFDLIANAVIESVELACEWEIPDPPEDRSFDPELVNVAVASDAADPYYLWYAGSAGGCERVPQGWYYDDPADPAMIHACPQTCEWLRGQTQARVEIEFGCEAKLY